VPRPIYPWKKWPFGGNRIRALTAANAGSSFSRRWWTRAKPPRRPAHCGVSTETVHQLISAYKRHGVAAVETAGKGGRRYGYLTLEQEQQFLAPFFAQAQVGTITTVATIKQAFEAQVGQEVAETTRLTLAPSSWLAQARPALLPSESQRRRNKLRLKKLRTDRPGRGRHACPRRSATRVKDG
jgi:hypothetical protein